MKTPLLPTPISPKNNNLPAWMENIAPLPEWVSEMPPVTGSPAELDAVWDRIHKAQRDIPENAFEPTPITLGEKLLFAGVGACVAFLLVGTLMCFF